MTLSMGRRSARKVRARDAGTDQNDSTLKMVLKLSAQEHANKTSRPVSPSLSAVSNDSESSSVSKTTSKKRTKKQSGPQPSKVAKTDDGSSIAASDFVPTERNLRDRSKAPSPKPQSTALIDTLHYFQKQMERKDNQHFFAFPINDMIAPDYSKVINTPMDLGTTRSKIESKKYTNLMEYKADIKLICTNAMNYNHPDTVYYKAAQNLLEYAIKSMSKERLLSLRKNQPMMSGLLDSEMALHLDVDASDYIAPSRAQKKQKDSNAYLSFEPIPDHLPAKDMIAIAKERAAEMSEQLAKMQPNSKMGFLKVSQDGSTTLSILNPDHSGYVSEKEKVITLGEKIGRLKAGRPFLETIPVEDDYTEAKPVKYLNYGPFASSAPTYDSSFSTLTKEETNLLLSYYGTQNSIDYIQSLRTFVADSDQNLINMIENLLDNKTGGKHTQAQGALKEMRNKKATVLDDNTAGTTKPDTDKPSPSVDFDALTSLSDLGIDVSFLEHFKAQHANKTQQGLDKVAEGITKLSDLQNERLSSPPTSGNAKNVGQSEGKVAEELSSQLVDLTADVKPGDLTDSAQIQAALAVGPVEEEAKSKDVVNEILTKSEDDIGVNQITEALEPDLTVGISPSQQQSS